MIPVLNVLISALLISFTAWLSGKHPKLAGFVIALPLSTLLVLPMSYLQHGDAGNTVEFAKSIFVAIPISLLFFVPFLMSGRWSANFWTLYLVGAALLPLGYLAHRAIVTRL